MHGHLNVKLDSNIKMKAINYESYELAWSA